MADYTPPQDLAAEQAVLGSMLLSATALDAVAGQLRGPDFYRLAHEFIFTAAVDLRERREPVDPVTVAAELAKRGQLDQIGGPLALAELVAAVSVTSNASYYAGLIREKAVLRRLVDASARIHQTAVEGAGDASDVLARAQDLLSTIQPPTARQAGARVADLWPDVVDLIERGGVRGPALPWSDLDQLLHGLQPGKLYVVGARPGVGKSMLGQSFLAHWAGKHGRDAFLASFEMPAREVSMRLLSAKAAVHYSAMVDGTLSETDWAKVARASSWEGAGRIVIADDTGATMAEIRAGARDLARRGNLGLVVIDYAGLVTPRDPRLSRQEQVAEVSREAKKLAMELDVPVVLLSQLNRESAGGRPPVLTDLRESGGLEQDADVVILLHMPTDEQTGIMSDWDLHVIVAKNRGGQLGSVRLVRQAFIMRIVLRDRAAEYRNT